MSGILEEISGKLDAILEALQSGATPSKAAEPADEPAPRKRTRTPDKTKAAAVTLDAVKAKLKAVLDGKGRKTAVGILETFDASKVGDLEEGQFSDFIKACDEALSGESDDDMGID